jgi:hypothetical protein
MRIEHMVRDYYYEALIRPIPGLLVDAVGRVTAVVWLLACVLGGVGSYKVADGVLAPAWWLLILVGGVLLVALARANHEYVKELRRNATDVTPEPPAAMTTNVHVGNVTNNYIRWIDTAERTTISGIGPSPSMRVTRYVRRSRQREELPLDDDPS